MTSCVVVAGARPNFMKIAPVLTELEAQGVATTLVHTGQHYDSAMSEVFFEQLGIRAPDHHLEVGSGSHAVQTARTMERFEPLLLASPPDIVVVVGDVNSTLACALVAAKLTVPVAHVEAGLRSGDWSMPEEVNRVVTDRLSHVLLAPSEDAVTNLRREGIEDGAIHLVGNVMVDTLLTNLDRARSVSLLSDLGLRAREYALLTLHRPSNVDDLVTLNGLLAAVREVAEELPVVWPVHPRVVQHTRDLPKGLRVMPPLSYLEFIALQDGARLIMTDSGGVQEESTVLGVPCLTLRTTTERPITIDQGTNQLAGTDPENIVRLVRKILAGDGPPVRQPALWDGRAAQRSVTAMLKSLS